MQKDSMIPQERSAAVTRALREAFGVPAFEDIRTVANDGFSGALVYRIVVQESPFLLRMITRTNDSTTSDHFACMKAAAEAGLAPKVHYSSVEDRISITDFVEAVPFSAAEALIRMPAVLRKLHALPPFPPRASHLNTSCTFLLHEGPARGAIIQKFQAANILPKAESDELFVRYAQTAAAYSLDSLDMVSSHNDLFKPDNVLFDGRRVWLVDWEAAFLNDRYADLAVVANLLVSNEAEERQFLQEYLGQPADEYQLAKLHLMRQVTHIFYTIAFLMLGSSGKPIDLSEALPAFRDVQHRFWTGAFKLADNSAKLVYGRIHLNQLFENARRARFDESLRIASDRRGGKTGNQDPPSKFASASES
jgi:aminoglycoside phosphotransferase (APT) family kinase protein